MNFLAIDVETLGLNSETDSLIEIGIIAADLKTPIEKLERFHCYVTHGYYQGDPRAMSWHQRILQRISEQEKGFNYYNKNCVSMMIEAWLDQIKYPNVITVAGKNFMGFDIKFLLKCPGIICNQNNNIYIGGYRVHHRAIDSAILYLDPEKDTELPDTNLCCQRAGLKKQSDHTALGDCEIIVQLLRTYYES